MRAALVADGRSFRLAGSGLSGFQGGFSAKVRVGDEKHELTSDRGVVLGPVQHLSEATPYGQADVGATGLRFEDAQVDLLFRLGQVPGVAGVLAQVGIRNTGQRPVEVYTMVPAILRGRLGGSPADWLVSRLHPRSRFPTQRVADIGNVLHIWEAGCLYRADGSGFLFGPVGTPIAYIDTRITQSGDGSVELNMIAQMGPLQVDPGETRWSQQVLLLVEPPQQALARWAEWVGKTHGARSNFGALSGWSSSHYLVGAVSGKEVLEVTDAVLQSHGQLHPEVIQIDTGSEESGGTRKTNEPFPEDLGFYAKRISATGARPGLLVRALTDDQHPALDPAAWDDLARRVGQAVHHGFSYLKIEFYGTLSKPEIDPKKTSFEAMRDGLTKLRAAAGEDTYLLFSDHEPDRAAVGLVDSSSTGLAAKRPVVREAMPDVLRSYQLHKRWFAVDNCNYYMGTDPANLSEIEGGWPLVRTWMSMVGLSGGAAITSDPWHWESFKPFWRNVEAMTPPAHERADVLDLGVSEEWPRLIGHVLRPWGDATVALLWNPGTTEKAVTLDFAKASLNPSHRYAVWSFWDNRYLGVTQGSWSTPALAPSASQHLRFTDLDREPDAPVLIGSNLHIYCGAAETKLITSTRGLWQIELTDAGARNGDLFVYSRLPLDLKAATGCLVTGVSQAGEYVWRITLAERRHGALQRVDLNVLLPVTHQYWFWGLIAIVVASLAFATSRYFNNIDLQRLIALDQERARIARDMHDEVGSQLARLSMLGELLMGTSSVSSTERQRAQVMTRGVRQAAGDLENIIWAVNPKNDNLDQLAYRIYHYVEEFFSDTLVHCRFAPLPAIPAIAMAAETRAAVFGAVKEALANVLQHASASTLEVAMRIEHRQFEVSINDDGRGFYQAQCTRATNGNGLSNMHDRLEKIGGECLIESVPGKGTRVTLRWPLGKRGKP
ncbi:MAG: ATP-binding protein [Verrucomicrobiota bacterium]